MNKLQTKRGRPTAALFLFAIYSYISTLPRYYFEYLFMDFVKDFTITKEPKAVVKIEGEVPFEELLKHRTASINALGKNIEIDGFRKGKVPEDMLVTKLGEMTILNEMAERALAKVYPEVLKAHKIDAIGYPQVQITKLATDNPLGFTATVATVPVITLPDYKKIAGDTNQDKASTGPSARINPL